MVQRQKKTAQSDPNRTGEVQMRKNEYSGATHPHIRGSLAIVNKGLAMADFFLLPPRPKLGGFRGKSSGKIGSMNSNRRVQGTGSGSHSPTMFVSVSRAAKTICTQMIVGGRELGI
jgi:hypothetical protein